jgi:hypothetical protein
VTARLRGESRSVIVPRDHLREAHALLDAGRTMLSARALFVLFPFIQHDETVARFSRRDG